uniref:Poly [ADP-ribose] polymerase n=1 Tax=Amphiprion ocellaris TaxID=80972 RepID=A0AAQ5ZP14_AMPOC
MADLSCSSGMKRKLPEGILAEEPSPASSKVTLLGQSFLLLEIPADTNTTLPVWEALRARQVVITWTANPYSISVRLTPMTSEQGEASTSSRNESASSLTQSSGLYTSIQYVPQQHYVMLAISENVQLLQCPPVHHQRISAPPDPATSLIVLPPVDVTPPQPSTPTKNKVPPAILTPAGTPTQLQTPSKVSGPLLFHTKTTADVLICDSFLLGVCHAGEGCTMHHTRYPFHWQLHSVITQRWVDVSPRSQVALERIYCNINAENVFLKEGHISYNLNFDSMELDSPYIYDGVRRLTNSDSPARNPYFPCQWKIYWWKSTSWEEYDMNVSTLLLHAMSEKEPKCYFYIGPVKYMVDFTMMLQINITTRFQRDIRYRPVYRSPESMQPYLQTGIQCDSPQPVGDPPGMNFSVDPLEEFSSWYPPVWRLASEQECSLVDVPVGTQAYQKIRNLVHESMTEAMVDVISIQQVQNVLHWDKYQRQKMYMQKQRTEESEEPLERHLFHGTTKGASEDICHNNFDPRLAGVNGTAYGLGSYFATTALLSSRYSHTEEADEVYHMFLAKVLVGNIALGCTSYRRPPPYRSETRKHRLYDACVDDRAEGGSSAD